MTTSEAIGRATGGKAINLKQLERELAADGVDMSYGLGQTGEYVHTYTPVGTGNVEVEAADFSAASAAVVDQVMADHVAMRDKTPEEYSQEFQAPDTTLERRQELRDISAGLLPPEQVLM